ncbi:MAG: LCP family protein [Carbonactinosporaceae bacterium]
MSETERRQPEPTAGPISGSTARRTDEPAGGSTAGQAAAPATEGSEDAQVEEDFDFVADEDQNDVIDWLRFAETRSERRVERRRALRIRLIALLAVVGLAALGGAGYRLVSSLGTEEAGDTVSEQTVLFQLRGADGRAAANALLVRDPARGGDAVVLVPSELNVDVSGQGFTPLGRTMKVIGPTLSRSALSDLLGIRLGGSFVLDESSFTTLVDRLGGIEATVDADVVDESGEVIVPAGQGRLDGEQALAYAMFGDTPAERLPRLERVLAEVIAKLPNDRDAVLGLLQSLGIAADPSLPNGQLAGVLSTLSREAKADRLEYEILPLRSDGTNLLDVQAATSLVREVLGGSVAAAQSTGAPGRVLVQNASGDPARPDAARIKLLNSGYSYVDGGKAAKIHGATVVRAREGAAWEARQIALTLGLDESAVKEASSEQVLADIVVVLGTDFQS